MIRGAAMKKELVLVLDFGGQYNQLIARRVRELSVYSEMVPFNISYEEVLAKQPRGIILSGGPESVHVENAPTCDPRIFEMGVPVLGICYGMQLLAQHFGGQVAGGQLREYGRSILQITRPEDMLFKGLELDMQVWMSHGDSIKELPEGFQATARTSNCPFAAISNPERGLYGVQFHPEVKHTLLGMEILGKEKQIQMIDFKMIDLLGRWRHLGIPIGRFTPGILEHGIGFDGSNYGFAPVEKSDMIFIPDLSTAVFDPFTQVPTLSMIGDVFVISEPENYRFDQDPRAIAIKAEEYMASTGIADEIRIGPEYEFNVFDHVSYTCQPQKSSFSIDAHQAIWNSGNEEHQNLGYKIPLKGGYHIAPPQDILYDLRARMCLLMEENNIKVKYHHHEVGGPGQIEIEVEFGSSRNG
jgi:GMP synthase (glutamine-hydrolysing) A subunit